MLLLLWLIIGVALAGQFYDCPRVDVANEAELWDLLGADPRPIIVGSITDTAELPIDFVGEYGTVGADGTTQIDGVRVSSPNSRRPYTLTNAGYHPQIFHKTLLPQFPMDPRVASIDLRPIFSIGHKGTGETDIAHHYHSTSAMLLLQGEKVWALRPPGEPVCEG